jgi:hypothetical protein
MNNKSGKSISEESDPIDDLSENGGRIKPTANNLDVKEDDSSEFQGSFGEEDEKAFEDDDDMEESNEEMVRKKPKPIKKKLLQGPEITLLDLNGKALQCIYNGEQEELASELNKYRQINDGGKKFKYAITMCFWLCVHLEKTKMIPFVYEQDEWIKKLAQFIVKNYRELSSDDQKVDNQVRKIRRKQTVDTKKAQVSESSEEYVNLDEFEVDQEYDFSDHNTVKKFKHAMKTKAGQSLCTNALKIALIDQEEKVASVLLVEYAIKLERDMITRALVTEKFDFLRNMWVFQKNYVENGNNKKEYFSFDYLFKRIINVCEDKAMKRIEEVAGWKIKPDNESMLKSLLRNNADMAACKHSGFYIMDADIELFIYSIRNENDEFIKHALKESVFTINMLSDPILIDELIESLQDGRHIELCLNIMTYSDFGRWAQSDIRRFLEFIMDIINDSEEKNKILLTSNTIMALALMCEYLKRISKAINVFDRQCRYLLEEIHVLADQLVDNIEDELVESIFLDKDFKDRTLFKIVTQYNLYSFLSTGKVNTVLDIVWEGINSTDCDGNLVDFSLLTFLAGSSVKTIPGKRISIKQLLFNSYVSQSNELNFWFQYKYRHESVQYIFYKELFFAAGIAFAFQYINFRYLDLFSKEGYSSLATEALQKAYLEDQISTYNGFNFVGTIFAASMLYSVICRALFNSLSEVKAVWDKWTILDGITSIICIFCFTITGSITPEDILAPEKKQTFDSYVVIVLVAAWIRFFAFFLVIKSISRILMTLIKMFIDTTSFAIILV